jgi:3-methyladenine DNA glycosylase AlkD
MVAVLLSDLRSELKKYWRIDKNEFLQNFFHSNLKDSKEIFRGVTVPNSRKVAKQFIDLDFNDVQTLLESSVHEERLIALFILVLKYQRADEYTKSQIVRFYLRNTLYINDWDLVDSSADKILGDSLISKKDRNILHQLIDSPRWWERRIALIATFQLIKNNQEYQDTFKLVEKVLTDKHDLIHKAAGWMLREVGKRISKEKEEAFLQKHYKQMPRTMLRYAIEHFSENERKYYLTRV